MSGLIVTAMDTQGKTYIFDKPTPFNAANDPFLFGLKRGQEEAAKEIVTLLESMFWFQPPKENEPVIYRDQAIEAIRYKFGLEI